MNNLSVSGRAPIVALYYGFIIAAIVLLTSLEF